VNIHALALMAIFSPAVVSGQPAFDAASIRPSSSETRGGGFNTPPGRLNARNQSLRELIKFAFNIHDYQLTGGQGWVDGDRYDIAASTEGQSTMAQKRLMLQALLIERFGLVVHHDTKDISGYALTVAKGGPKLQAAKSDQGSMMLGRNPRGLRTLTAGEAQMTGLAAILADVLGRPVVDSTGLTELYDFTMEWTPDVGESPLSLKGNPGPEPGASAASDGPSIFSAVQEQLGLKLEPRKVPTEVTVVDRAQKPTLD
jgi:uncharacterized protein (TIGR03435 family)